MRVLYDGAAWLGGAPGGIRRYFQAIISRLPADWNPVVTTSGPGGAPVLGAHPRSPHVAVPPPRIPSEPRRPCPRALVLPAGRRRRPPDMVHPSYYFSLTGRPLDRLSAPVVLTVWDMIHERYPRELDPSGEVSALKRRAVAEAAAVICISSTTRRDLIDCFGTDGSKIVVTPLAPGIDGTRPDGPSPCPTHPTSCS